MGFGTTLILDSFPSKIKRVDVLQNLYDKLLNGPKLTRTLIFGLPVGYGGLEVPIAVTVVKYTDDASLKLANDCLPYGLTLIGMVEYEADEAQEVYATLDQVDCAVLLKVTTDEKIVCSTGLDFLTQVDINLVQESDFWNKQTTTFRLKGKMLLSSPLEMPDLKDCFASARKTVLNQAAYSLGKKLSTIILPPEGKFSISSDGDGKNQGSGKVGELVKSLKNDQENKDKGVVYTPPFNVVNVQIFFDKTKCTSYKNPLMVVFGKSAACKLFEHYIDLDTLVIVPNVLPNQQLYQHFNQAVCGQLEDGFHVSILQQLVNSISAEKPQVFHFWPSFGDHFVSVVYPQNTCLEKLRDNRIELHQLFNIRETRPYFRQSAAIFQSLVGLMSPHLSLKGKFSETECIKGHYEYRHYMQDGFNDDGWGCAYRSLQTIVSWFRLQGFTSRTVPTHKEIQECLVSLGDKPQSFIGSKQWIGSTEVSFVLEALLGVSCRIMALSNGAEMASRVSELQSHFRIHGTPIMVGGGVLAHTIIGASCEPDSDSDVNFLILDPHYTGKDDMKTILSKGWVGWKDSNFWSKKDFYNLCMPLLPSSI